MARVGLASVQGGMARGGLAAAAHQGTGRPSGFWHACQDLCPCPRPLQACPSPYCPGRPTCPRCPPQACPSPSCPGRPPCPRRPPQACPSPCPSGHCPRNFLQAPACPCPCLASHRPGLRHPPTPERPAVRLHPAPAAPRAGAGAEAYLLLLLPLQRDQAVLSLRGLTAGVWGALLPRYAGIGAGFLQAGSRSPGGMLALQQQLARLTRAPRGSASARRSRGWEGHRSAWPAGRRRRPGGC